MNGSVKVMILSVTVGHHDFAGGHILLGLSLAINKTIRKTSASLKIVSLLIAGGDILDVMVVYFLRFTE